MKRSDISSLDDLRAFAFVARLGSVRAAAEELSLTHGAVSRRVAKLSRDLGLKLLVPKGRGIDLTEDGDLLAQATLKSLVLINEALETIRAEGDAKPIVLSCERSVAMKWLIPRLSQFQDLHPDIAIHLSVGGGSLNFANEGVTLAIRRLDFLIDPRWVVQTLFKERIGVVMAPEMERAFRSGDYIGLGTRTRLDAWETLLEMRPAIPQPKELRLFDHHFLLAEAAASALGVAVCPLVVAINDIKTNRLIAPLGFELDGSSYGLIDPNPEFVTGQKELLSSWLMEACKEVA